MNRQVDRGDGVHMPLASDSFSAVPIKSGPNASSLIHKVLVELESFVHLEGNCSDKPLIKAMADMNRALALHGIEPVPDTRGVFHL